MSDTERTRDMTDAEVLEDLKTRRAGRKPARRGFVGDFPPIDGPTDWGMIIVYLFAIIGFLSVVAWISQLHP